MFIDASAIVAILAQEKGWQALDAKVDRSDRNLTSPLAHWESTIALTRIHGISVDRANAVVDLFIWKARSRSCR